MQGILILLLSFLATFIISKTTNLKPVSNYKNNFEYLPLLTSNLYADLLIIFITFAGVLGTGQSWKVLAQWYKKYRLSAMIADILIGVLYLMAARYVDYTYNLKLDLFNFGVLAVAIQLIFDFLFFLYILNTLNLPFFAIAAFFIVLPVFFDSAFTPSCIANFLFLNGSFI